MHLTSEQLEKLKQLSNIKLNSSESEDFLQKLDPIIAKLEELWSIDISEVSSSIGNWDRGEVVLRALENTFEWEDQKDIAEKIIKNVSHEVINNSVVIKSVLS